MGAYYAGNFLGKEKLWIEKKKNQPGDPGAVGRKCGQVKANWLGWGRGLGWGLRHRIDCSRWGSRDVCCSRRRRCHHHAASSAWPAGSRSGGVHVSSGGHSAWIACRTGGSRTSSRPCGCDSAVPAHQSEQTSYCSRARCKERGALLGQTKKKQSIHGQSEICDVFKTKGSVKLYKHLQIRSCSCVSENLIVETFFF